jgi:hypothetical protein
LTQILINKEVQLDTFNPPEIPSAMPAGLKPYKDRHRKRRQKKNPRKHKNHSDDEDASDGQDSKAKSIQCYYCYKHGYRLSECRLREKAKKIQNSNSKDLEKATANIADAVILASYTTLVTLIQKSSSCKIA